MKNRLTVNIEELASCRALTGGSGALPVIDFFKQLKQRTFPAKQRTKKYVKYVAPEALWTSPICAVLKRPKEVP